MTPPLGWKKPPPPTKERLMDMQSEKHSRHTRNSIKAGDFELKDGEFPSLAEATPKRHGNYGKNRKAQVNATPNEADVLNSASKIVNSPIFDELAKKHPIVKQLLSLLNDAGLNDVVSSREQLVLTKLKADSPKNLSLQRGTGVTLLMNDLVGEKQGVEATRVQVSPLKRDVDQGVTGVNLNSHLQVDENHVVLQQSVEELGLNENAPDAHHVFGEKPECNVPDTVESVESVHKTCVVKK